MPKDTPHIDPLTMQWVFPDGRRLPTIMGGSSMVHDEITVEDDDQAGDDDRAGGDDDQDDDEPEDDFEPPTKIEWERIQSALRNERRERKKLKREFEDKIQNMSTEGTAAAQVEIEKVRIETEQKVEKKWLKRTVRAEAKGLLIDAGATAPTAERLSKLVDLEKVTYDERDDELDGLEEEIEELITEHAESFKPKKEEEKDTGPVLRRPRIDGATRGQRGGSSGRPRVSSAEKLAAQALGRTARRR